MRDGYFAERRPRDYPSGSAQLGDDRGGVQPDVLAADQPVAELEHVQDAKTDAASVARNAQHRTDDGGRHQLFEDHRVAGYVPMQDFFFLGTKVRRQVLVELACLSLA